MEIRYEKDLTHAIISSQEKERLRIAQDLHDDISSKLSVVSLNIHLLDTDSLTREEYTELKNKLSTWSTPQQKVPDRFLTICFRRSWKIWSACGNRCIVLRN
ncbi:hypothetical protein EJ377_18275 [Chryseobacterium arthrosphaerae]|uniref:Signal transduction histidine kinase subgroup 3 dimerisation and phosphoacceptor domain-containing protein n=1 Tax=Chryseobacterium arthrosphaerae TaxID=651561 RepID=A0A3S0N317_9FLAO|nr:hypothetical protein EJ377_18275 [Chryseobacterium arthrosphaerae]